MVPVEVGDGLAEFGQPDCTRVGQGTTVGGIACRREEGGRTVYYAPEEISREAERALLTADGGAVEIGRVVKMSKSKKNVVDPDTIVARYGADAVRWFMLSDSPPERDVEWTAAGAEAASKFLGRLWRLAEDSGAGNAGDREDEALTRATHRAIDEITRAIEGFSDGSVPVLVATDIAARGIDVADVSLVVHIDPPAEHKAYLHRAGRTARGGAAGTVVTLVMDEQRKEVSALINKAGVTATEHDISSRDIPAGAPVLKEVTGARKPNGPALPPPGQATPQNQAKPAKKKSPSQRRRPGSRNTRRRGR